MKVYVLKYEWRTSASGDGNDVLGVYKNIDDATAALKIQSNNIIKALVEGICKYDGADLENPSVNERRHWQIEHGMFDEYQELIIIEREMIE